VGHPDSIFGDKTRAAVLAFQGDNGLETDGIVGRMTWAALAEGQKRPVRAVTEDDLRARGSKTIAEADKIQKGSQRAGAGVVGIVTVDTAIKAIEKVQDSQTALEAAQQVLFDNWPVILLGLTGVVIWKYGPKLARSIISNRVEDAQTGAHLGL
jgi:peptidoglycan hydrolase-like protein with peptidoglycan-binding domain